MRDSEMGLKFVITVATLLVLYSQAGAGDFTCDELTPIKKASISIGNAVIANDISTILGYVHDGGVWFADGHYEKSEVVEYITDKSSWLYKSLFWGMDSIKERLSLPVAIKKIYKIDSGAPLVEYESKSNDFDKVVENCLIEIDGKYYFDGIFYCR